MGQQTSSLNCKVNELDKKNEIFETKQVAVNQSKPLKTIQSQIQSIQQQSTNTKLSKTSSKRNLTEGLIFSKPSTIQNKQKITIPQHQSITKVSEFPFTKSIKQRKYYVEQKQKTLGEIVESRYNTSKHFPYSQILSLLQTLIYSLAYFQKKKIKHHDYYPANIYYIAGKFKLINPLEIKASAFQLTSNRERFSFLSPELILAILDEQAQNQLEIDLINKSDIFAIGMILLEVSTLLPSSECYDQESYNIIDQIIQERIAKTAKIYTPKMAQIISLMLEYQHQKRLDSIKLAQIIHRQIQSEKQTAFQMENPNKNLHNPQVRGPPPMQSGQIPQNMLPPQMVQRGPSLPPLPPYTHQSFKMQNLNQNAIAVTVPNQLYTRISPNNQGFLSSSSLQQKLRVIELIKQNPHEHQQDSQGEGDKTKINMMKLKSNQIYTHLVQNQKPRQVTRNLLMAPETNIQQINSPREQYPFVESVYRQNQVKIQNPIQIRNNINLDKQNNEQINRKMFSTQNKMQNAPYQFQIRRQNNENGFQNNIGNIQKRQVKKQIDNHNASTTLRTMSFNNYVSQPKITIPNYAYSLPMDTYDPYQGSKLKHPHEENEINNQIKIQQTLNSPRLTIQKQKQKIELKLEKNGSNQKHQTLQERVQRILQMSRNVK